jgi:hypothetical protein
MSAVWLWVRADLRRRWRSWVVLGLLAGISVGLACGAIAGARRTERALPTFERVGRLPDAAVLPNDPAFDAAKQKAVANLPEVTATAPFLVPFLVEIARPAGAESGLVPIGAYSAERFVKPLVEGRVPDPHRADEIVVNENMRDRYGLDIGSTMTLVQHPAPPGALPPELVPSGDVRFRQKLRVVGISKATDDSVDSTPSAGFYEKYRERLIGVTNEFVDLRHGSADFTKFQADVQKIVGHPVNVSRAESLFGVAKVSEVSRVEQGGLLLFALAVLVGAGALVGQALVRAVTAGASDLPTWRAIGADRRVVVRAMVLPTVVTAAVGAVTAVVVAIALSPRFPIALTRHYELDIGLHVDWLVLGLGAVGLAAAVLVSAWATAEIRVRRRVVTRPRASAAARLATTVGMSPPMLIGSRLAVEPGQGRRAVPVRSAMIGAIVGVLGVVGCLTFRAGLSDTVADPARSGVVWDQFFAAPGVVPPAERAKVAGDKAVAATLDALWARAVRINGTATPTWGTTPVKGNINLVVLDGHAPEGRREIALAPTTMEDLGLRIGDRVRVGDGAGRPMRVVGRALLPASSHTDYDESAWMTLGALQSVIPPAEERGAEDTEDWLLMRWQPGADVHAAQKRIAKMAEGQDTFVEPATLPSAVVSLGQLRSLPFALAVFFGLLAVATVAHALVTTVRRRRHDLAVLRSIGFTRGDARVAIAWQATLIAIIGLVVGIPLGIITGRVIWKQLAESFPVAYTPPLTLVAVALVVPVAIGIANLVAAGPAHAATRIRPARVLRTE